MKRFDFHEAGGLFDLAIVGGGIHGAAMAYLAALNGLSTALFERDDFASAASSNSQKVIHGGLRYLQKLDLKRVAESIRERQRFYHLFPHIVKPLPCALPTTGYGMKSNEAFLLAFFIYRCIQSCICRGKLGMHQDQQPRILSRQEMLDFFPQIAQQSFRGGALWYDGMCCEPERVILSLLQSASSLGAGIANYCGVQKLESLDDGRIGLTVHDRIEKRASVVYAEKVALCTGAYFKESLGLEPLPEPLGKLTIIRGINLVYPAFIKSKVSLGIKAGAGKLSRFFFVVPWKNYSVGGTHWQQVADVNPSREGDVQKIGEEFHRDMQRPFSELQIYPEFMRMHVGCVPGKKSTEKNETDASNRVLSHYMFVDREQETKGRILQIVGVKFTTAFDVAHKALQKLFPQKKIKDTRKLSHVPHGSSFYGHHDVALQKYREQFADLLTETQIDTVFALFGSELPRIVEHYLKGSDETSKLDDIELYKGLTSYCVDKEQSFFLTDIIDRRLFPNSPDLPSPDILSAIAGQMALLLDWTEQRKEQELKEVLNRVV